MPFARHGTTVEPYTCPTAELDSRSAQLPSSKHACRFSLPTQRGSWIMGSIGGLPGASPPRLRHLLRRVCPLRQSALLSHFCRVCATSTPYPHPPISSLATSAVGSWAAWCSPRSFTATATYYTKMPESHGLVASNDRVLSSLNPSFK